MDGSQGVDAGQSEVLVTGDDVPATVVVVRTDVLVTAQRRHGHSAHVSEGRQVIGQSAVYVTLYYGQTQTAHTMIQ